MKCLCNISCRIFKEIDMYGKEPELYYKGRSKKTSWIGRIFTFLFIFLYIAIVIYKVVKTIKKNDVTFFDTFIYEDKPPSIQLSSEKFYGGFALEDPNTYDAYIDEGIYFPKAYFKKTERKGSDFEWDIKEIELERCKLEKFGSRFKDSFKTKALNNYYCFKDMDYTLEGHFSYDRYSFFFIQFFPCVNTTENQKCKPPEEIDFDLKNTFINLEMQDIELTPKNYNQPIRGRDVDIFTTVGKRLFREIHVFYQIVNIETNLDFIGLDEYENIKSESYLKYDEMLVMSNFLETNIYETGESFCDVTIKLSDNVRTERREYTKLLTILGDVGGLMEVLFSLFRILCSFSVDILYDISLVNNLFNFDLNKQLVVSKKREIIRKKVLFKDDEDKKEVKHYNSNKYITQNTIALSGDILTCEGAVTGSENRIKESEEIQKNNENLSEIKKDDLRKNIKYSTSFKNYKSNINRNRNKKLTAINLRNRKKSKAINNIKVESENNNQKIVNKIKINKACLYCCFLFARKRTNLDNILLDEALNIISEKLDIFNLFDKIYKVEQIKEKVEENALYEVMSKDCKIKLLSVNN